MELGAGFDTDLVIIFPGSPDLFEQTCGTAPQWGAFGVDALSMGGRGNPGGYRGGLPQPEGSSSSWFAAVTRAIPKGTAAGLRHLDVVPTLSSPSPHFVWI